ncbi:MAG: class I SAM-dependent methyltransferase [Erysipelotrichaceae bacterium]
MNKLANNWTDYEVIDSGNGDKIDRFGPYVLRRPDPSCIWENKHLSQNKINAQYHRSNKGGGSWEYLTKIPESWNIKYQHLTFKVSLTNFKHTGIFPEQACNWDFMMNKINNSSLKEIRILNLFAYSGCATMACASTKATEVVHVDASKGMISWAKENMELCHLENKHIRYIVDDCLKFIKREIKRGRKYQGILMDPPSYGRGPNNELWKFEEQINELIAQASELLADDALFFLVNSYTTGISSTVLNNILQTTFNKRKGQITSGELQLPITKNSLILPCGIYGLWENND